MDTSVVVKVWRLPFIAAAVMCISGGMDDAAMLSAQSAVGALNDSLGASMPELAGAALVAPSWFLLYSQWWGAHNGWAWVAAAAWVSRTLTDHLTHNPNSVDLLAQRVAVALCPPSIMVCANTFIATIYCT